MRFVSGTSPADQLAISRLLDEALAVSESPAAMVLLGVEPIRITDTVPAMGTDLSTGHLLVNRAWLETATPAQRLEGLNHEAFRRASQQSTAAGEAEIHETLIRALEATRSLSGTDMTDPVDLADAETTPSQTPAKRRGR